MEKQLSLGKDFLQTADTTILVMEDKGVIDLNELAKEELVNRCLDKKW